MIFKFLRGPLEKLEFGDRTEKYKIKNLFIEYLHKSICKVQKM